MEDLVGALLKDSTIYNSSISLVSKSIIAGKLMAVAIFPLSIGWSYLKNIFNNGTFKGQVVDIGYIVKSLIIFSLVGAAPNALEIIASFIKYGLDQFSINSDNILITTKSIYEASMNINIDENGTKMGDVGTWDLLTSLNLSSLIYMAVGVVSMIVCLIIRVVMTVLTNYVAVFLFIVSPISMALSLFPGKEKTFMSLLGYFWSAMGCFLTMSILDHLVFNATVTAIFEKSEGIDINAFIIFNVVSIIMYLLTFWLTTMYMGAPSAGQAAGVVGAMATMGASALLAGGVAASGVGSNITQSASNAGSMAAKTGRDALSD